MRTINLHQLTCFLAVAEELNFSRAAKRLHLSQPPLTRQIQAIESALDVKLFVRTSHDVRLTSAGETLLPEARAVLGRLERAVHMTRRAAQGETGTLRLAYESHSLYSVVPISIRLFRKRFPDVHVTVEERSTAEQVQAFAANELDAAFFTPPVILPPNLELNRERLAQLPCVVALRKDQNLAKKERIALSDLRDEFFVLHSMEGRDVLSTNLIAACHQCGFTPKIAASARSLEMVLGFVAAGLGVAVLSDAAQHFQRRNLLYRRLEANALMDLEFELMWRVDPSSKCVLHFLDILRSTVAGITRERMHRDPDLFKQVAARRHAAQHTRKR